jgi:hypothetical protein
MEAFPPLVRRTKPLTLPDAAPYSDADEEEAFWALTINSSTRPALTLLAAFLLDWRRISAASSAGRKPFSATQSTYGSFRISSCTRDAIRCNQGHSVSLGGTWEQSAHLLFSRRGAITGNHGYSVALRATRGHSGALSGTQTHSFAISSPASHATQSGEISGNQWQSVAISGNQLTCTSRDEAVTMHAYPSYPASAARRSSSIPSISGWPRC